MKFTCTKREPRETVNCVSSFGAGVARTRVSSAASSLPPDERPKAEPKFGEGLLGGEKELVEMELVEAVETFK